MSDFADFGTLWPEGEPLTARQRQAQLTVHQCPHEAYEFASMFDDWYNDEGSYDPEELEGEESPGPPAPITFTIDLPTLMAPTE